MTDKKEEFVLVGESFDPDAAEAELAKAKAKAEKAKAKGFDTAQIDAVMVTILGTLAADHALRELRDVVRKAPRDTLMVAATAIASGKLMWALQSMTAEMEKVTPGYAELVRETQQNIEKKGKR